MSRAVLVVDMQEGMADRIRGGRPTATPDAPGKIATLLADARAKGRPVIHVLHDDPDPGSPFRRGQPEAAPMACAAPPVWRNGVLETRLVSLPRHRS